MSQEEILEIIKEHPGIPQSNIKNHTDLSQPTIVEQCRRLTAKRLIRREDIPKCRGQGYKLYAEEI